MDFNEELKAVFDCGYKLEEYLIKQGYTEEGCTGTCSDCSNKGNFTRWMEFEYTEERKKPTQEELNSVCPEGFVYILMEDDSYEESFCIGVSHK